MKQKLLIISMLVWLFKLNSQTPHWAQMGTIKFSGDYVRSLFADTITNTLYIGGGFEYTGGKKCRGAARWNGTDWDTMGVGFDKTNPSSFGNDVYKILRYKNKIYYFGSFYQAGKYFTKGMAMWDGAQWDSTGVYPNGHVFDADVYNDTLYICGTFTKIGNMNTNYAAKFDGTNWYPMSFPFTTDGPITRIRAFKDKVYGVGAWYANGFSLTAEYTQALGWKPSLGVQGGIAKGVFGLERIDSLLYFFGRFSHISQMNSPDIVGWSGTKLYGFGVGVDPNDANSYIGNIKKINGKIYVMGTLTNAGGMYLNVGFNKTINLASFDNNQWCVYADTLDNVVFDMAKFNGDLVMCGAFYSIGSDSIRKVAKWQGGSYTYSCSPYTLGISGVGINEYERNSFELKLHPNPVTDILYLTFNNESLIPTNTENSKVEIFNCLGEKVIQAEFKSELDVSQLKQGCYLLRVSTPDDSRSNSKFIKQ